MKQRFVLLKDVAGDSTKTIIDLLGVHPHYPDLYKVVLAVGYKTKGWCNNHFDTGFVDSAETLEDLVEKYLVDFL